MGARVILKQSFFLLASGGIAFTAAAGLPDLVFVDGFEEPGGVVSCESTGPDFPPTGYERAYATTLQQLWYETTGEPIGGGYAEFHFEGGDYQAHRFDRTMFAGGNLYTFNADLANAGTGRVGADFRYITVSECPGDFRLPENNSAEDPTLRPACRVQVGSEGVFMYINWGAPHPSFCSLDPEKTYYFNVIFDDPTDGFDATVSCNTSTGLNHCGFRVSAGGGE